MTTERVFGFDLRSSPQEDVRQYLPFLKYLEYQTRYRFRLRFTPKDSDIIEDLGKGIMHFSAIGATSFIHANQHHDVIPLVRGKNTHNQANYRSYLVVRPNSTVSKLSQICGKRMVFGNQTSTQGHLIPRIILQQNNIPLSDFQSYDYTGFHLSCANTVVSNRADVCGMQDTMAEEMSRNGLLKILYRSKLYPSSGISAHAKVSTQIIRQIQYALLQFDPNDKHKSSLYNWHKTEMPNGFVRTSEADYADLKSWMLKLGFLKNTAER
ncbi:MAG: PhnD/SsuA/transferrin family substrate-binding protein [Gammaproteobacteria bacterium]|nr:PhnD/SsuA/transferrin family substrate-binding protein [Gammaproteobacteria bacterium]